MEGYLREISSAQDRMGDQIRDTTRRFKEIYYLIFGFLIAGFLIFVGRALTEKFGEWV